MLSVVKKVRPIKRGDLQSPYPIDMLANAWVLGIANPQSIKRLGHFFRRIANPPERLTEERTYPALLALILAIIYHRLSLAYLLYLELSF